MRAYQLTEAGVDSLAPVTVPDPVPGPGEILIRVRAASLNFLDLLVARGQYGIARFPLVPVCDGAGEIAALGADVTGLAVGQRVIPHFMPDWQAGRMTAAAVRRQRGVTTGGAMGEYVTAPAHSVAIMPGHLTFHEAATLPIAATTAWSAIHAGDVRPGSTVLILGTGGVSLFAVQLAKAAGARVIVTSSSDAKLDLAAKAGADELLNYYSVPAWDDAVLEITDGAGADLVVETGGRDTFERSVNAAATGGHIQVVGFLSGGDLNFAGLPLNLKALTLAGTNCGPVAAFRDMVRAVGQHQIRPVIAREFSADGLTGAYGELENSGNFGKITIDAL